MLSAMHLMPSDTEKLLLAVAGMVARDRLARGVKLNHPEAVALLSTWVIERAREGASVTQLMAEGREVLSADDVMDGVAGMISDVQVEATFPDGRKLVTLHWPIQPTPIEDDVPGAARAATAGTDTDAHAKPGVTGEAGDIDLNPRPDGERKTLRFNNTADRPIQIGSHFHLPDVNAALDFDRDEARGFRLDIPSGTSIRFEPGVSKELPIVSLQGARHVPGLQITNQEHSA